MSLRLNFPRSSRRAALVLLTMTSLAGCARSTQPLIELPRLPGAPAEFGKPVELPAPAKGKSLKVFALENRAAALEANRRLEDDGEFYEDVSREFGKN